MDLRTPAWVALPILLAASPIEALSTDVQLRIQNILEFEDPQEGDDPSSDSGDFDTGSGSARGFANFGFFGGGLPTHFTGAEIRFDIDTNDVIAAQSFSAAPIQWSFSDSDPGRTGPVDLRVDMELDWNLEFGTGFGGLASAFASFDRYDAMGDFQESFGSFSCTSINRAAPSCAGSPGWDLSGVSVVFNGSSYDITGDASLEFSGGWVNSVDNFFGPGFGTSVSLPGGMAGDFVNYGKGNQLDWGMTSLESSVTVSPLPEPAGAVLVSLALGAWFCRRVRRGSRQLD